MSEKKETSSRVKASMKYNAKAVKQIKLNLNKKTDADVIEALAASGNMQGYIKDLIRKDINGDNQKNEISKKIVDGEFLEGQFVIVEIDGREFRRKVYYSHKWGDLVITILGNEYAKYEFKD